MVVRRDGEFVAALDNLVLKLAPNPDIVPIVYKITYPITKTFIYYYNHIGNCKGNNDGGVLQHPTIRSCDGMSNTTPTDDIHDPNNKIYARYKKACKFCNSQSIVKNGKKDGIQQYLCKDCGHQFFLNGRLPNVQNDKVVFSLIDLLERLERVVQHLEVVSPVLQDGLDTVGHDGVVVDDQYSRGLLQGDFFLAGTFHECSLGCEGAASFSVQREHDGKTGAHILLAVAFDRPVELGDQFPDHGKPQARVPVL